MAPNAEPLHFPLATADETAVLVRMHATLEPELAGLACAAWPDVTGPIRLLRFLHGFDHDEEKALAAVRSMLELRRSYGFDRVHDQWCSMPCTHTSGFPHQAIVSKHMPSITTLALSVDGHPIVYSAIGKQDNRACLAELGEEGYLEFYIAQCESRMAQLHALSMVQRAMTKLVMVLDLKSVSFWSLAGSSKKTWREISKKHLDAINSSMAESLARMYVINAAGWVVSFYNGIKGLLPAKTQQKIVILGGESQFLPQLRTQMDETALQAMLAAMRNDYTAADAAAAAAAEAIAAATAAATDANTSADAAADAADAEADATDADAAATDAAAAAADAAADDDAAADAADDDDAAAAAAAELATSSAPAPAVTAAAATAAPSPQPWYRQSAHAPLPAATPDGYAGGGRFPCSADDLRQVLAYRARWADSSRALLPSLPPYAGLSSAAEAGEGLRSTDARQIESHLAPAAWAAELASGPIRLAAEDVAAHRAALRRVLRAWCVLRADWGYARSVGRAAAVLLCVAGHDEAAAFAALAALIHRLPLDFFAEADAEGSGPAYRGFQVECGVMLQRAAAAHPRLMRAAGGAVGRALPLAATRWCLDLFVGTLPLAPLLAAWDLIVTSSPSSGLLSGLLPCLSGGMDRATLSNLDPSSVTASVTTRATTRVATPSSYGRSSPPPPRCNPRLEPAPPHDPPSPPPPRPPTTTTALQPRRRKLGERGWAAAAPTGVRRPPRGAAQHHPARPATRMAGSGRRRAL